MAVSFVYIMSSLSATLYVGVTANLRKRLIAHREGRGSQFTARYRINRLVYFEAWPRIEEAIARETQIKTWRREKKVDLIDRVNPAWHDLSEAVLRVSSVSDPQWLIETIRALEERSRPRGQGTGNARSEERDGTKHDPDE